MHSFKRFGEEKLPDRECFCSSVKDRTNGEKLDGHISDEDYLMCKKIWNEFNMKNMGDYILMFCYQLMFLKSLLTHA